MFSIILIYNSTNNIDDIYKYITHINNINIKNYKINILIINCNNEIPIDTKKIENENINVNIYNFSTDFNDSFYNDIINNINTDKILFTSLNVFLTDITIDWISNVNLDTESFIKTNTFIINNISQQFYENFNNNIYNHIIENINSISNEYGLLPIEKDIFIDIFNKNKNIHTIENSDLIKNNLYFLNDSQDFLLLDRNIIKKIGFNINNNNPNYTFQYVILQLIENNYKMIKLPYILSVYKLNIKYDNTIIDKSNLIESSVDFNKFINYKVLNLNTNKTTSIIRNQIKTIKGYNTVDTIKENQKLKNKINELENNIKNIKNQKINNNQNDEIINNQNNQNDEIINNQNNQIINKYNDLINDFKILQEQYNFLISKNQKLQEEYNILESKLQDTITENKIGKENILLKLYDIIHYDIDN
tara:strand:- start:2219 stop:3475 length:1257 start_codon:yes stop_codon:yes gene_type:complete